MGNESPSEFFEKSQVLASIFSKEAKDILSKDGLAAQVFLFSRGKEADNCAWVEGDAINLGYLLNRFMRSLLKHDIFNAEKLRFMLEKTIELYESEKRRKNDLEQQG